MGRKSAVKRIALVYRINTDQASRRAKELATSLKKKKYQVLVTGEDQEKADGDDVDLIVVLGGDGTYLRAVHMFEGRRIPVLGFNMGSLGFLTVHPAAKIESLIEKTLKGKMTFEPRAMIQAEIHRGSKRRGIFHALNDIVVERGSHSQLINARLVLDGRNVAELKADGFIVATPTGSTAYNLAAGGPILDGKCKAFAVTPVAPHALTTRPLIIPDDSEMELHLVKGRDQKAHFIVDGQKVLDLTDEDEVLLKRSSYDHMAVRESGFNDFHLLRDKLKFGDRA